MNARLHRRLIASAALACAAFAAPQAEAENGRIWIAHTYVISYQHLDFWDAEDRLALLKQIEAAAEEYCDVPLPRSDRRACARKTIDETLKGAPDVVERAMTLARIDRDSARQAMR